MTTATIGIDRGWVRVLRQDGIEAFARDLGVSAGWVRVVLDVRPLRRVREVVAAALGGVPGARVDSLERVVTAEGELGALAIAANDALTRFIGVVYGADSYARIDGLCAAPHRARFEGLVRPLIARLPLGLGRARVRRFFFRPPAGWRPLERQLAVRFFPERFPREHAAISVLPALPLASAASPWRRFLHDDLYAGFRLDAPPVHEPSDNAHGLRGELVTVQGQRPLDERRVVVVTASLDDGTFAYLARLETSAAHAEAHGAVLRELVASMRPLPAAPVEALHGAPSPWEVE